MNTIKEDAVYAVFNEYFSHIEDPRQVHKINHLLSEILFITGLTCCFLAFMLLSSSNNR